MMVLVVLPKRVHGCFNATPTHGSRLVQHSRRRQRASFDILRIATPARAREILGSQAKGPGRFFSFVKDNK